MKEWECSSCGYVFSDIGDDDVSQGLKAGISFSSLSAHFRCHICGAPKERFKLREKARQKRAKTPAQPGAARR